MKRFRLGAPTALAGDVASARERRAASGRRARHFEAALVGQVPTRFKGLLPPGLVAWGPNRAGELMILMCSMTTYYDSI